MTPLSRVPSSLQRWPHCRSERLSLFCKGVACAANGCYSSGHTSSKWLSQVWHPPHLCPEALLKAQASKDTELQLGSCQPVWGPCGPLWECEEKVMWERSSQGTVTDTHTSAYGDNPCRELGALADFDQSMSP